MSIRLRFTLLYTLILALTLTIFGLALYTIQAHDTMNSLKQDLVHAAGGLADATLHANSHSGPPPDGQEPQHPPSGDGALPPIPLDQFSNDPSLQSLSERQ